MKKAASAGALKPEEERRGERRWALVIVAICLLWLIGMVAASVIGYEYKTPTRIENWRPDPTPR